MCVCACVCACVCVGVCIQPITQRNSTSTHLIRFISKLRGQIGAGDYVGLPETMAAAVTSRKQYMTINIRKHETARSLTSRKYCSVSGSEPYAGPAPAPSYLAAFRARLLEWGFALRMKGLRWIE